jgi:CRP-like cAMP-binding protein
MAHSPEGNLLLNTLTPDALAALDVHEEDPALGAVLMSADETPDAIFFPYPGAMVSIVRTTENGSTVEAGVIGAEGMFVVQTVLSAPAPTGSDAIVQIAGRFARVEYALLRAQFRVNEPFRDRLLEFASVFLDQITQNLVCNRLHQIEQRLAKWLLMVRERIGTDRLSLTHEFLAHMLGVHRPGVSIAVAALELDGVIRHGRNSITIRDRAGLLERACECHAALHGKLQHFRADLT